MELRCACQRLAANGHPSENGFHSVHPTMPSWQVGMFPRVKASGVGHSWFKDMFCEDGGGNAKGGWLHGGHTRRAGRAPGRLLGIHQCSPAHGTARICVLPALTAPVQVPGMTASP